MLLWLRGRGIGFVEPYIIKTESKKAIDSFQRPRYAYRTKEAPACKSTSERPPELTKWLIESQKNKQIHHTGNLFRGVIVALVFFGSFVSQTEIARAGFLDDIIKSVFAETNTGDKQLTAQSMPLLTAATGDDTSAEEYMVSDEGALLSASGPTGGVAELTELQAQTAAGTISTYTVDEGDSIAAIATKYGISANTILWANGLNRKSKLKVGQTLVILPISSVQHKVVKGDTIQKIAKRYSGDVDEILSYNGLEDGKLVVGDTVIIPDGEMPAAPIPAKTGTAKVNKYSGPEIAGYFIHPAPGTRKSQRLHGHNGIDLAGPVGTSIRAAAAGTVIVANVGGWGGGYGSYIVIRHNNGTQTLYGHLSRVDVRVGQSVDRGEPIGALGNTGRSTGPHLHFEVRGAKNPF